LLESDPTFCDGVCWSYTAPDVPGLVYLESNPYTKCAVVANPPGFTKPPNAAAVGELVDGEPVAADGFETGGGFEPEPPPPVEGGPAPGTAAPALVAGAESPPSLCAMTVHVSVWP
jgi:hypothetical protein